VKEVISVKGSEENTFWKWVNEQFQEQIEELRKESVTRNPRKPVDCGSPPVPPRLKEKIRR
jgi:hypothetical protein